MLINNNNNNNNNNKREWFKPADKLLNFLVFYLSRT